MVDLGAYLYRLAQAQYPIVSSTPIAQASTPA
jgi:hypothetical protein